jgi:hypothetical protein
MIDVPEPHPPILPQAETPAVYGPVDQPPKWPTNPAPVPSSQSPLHTIPKWVWAAVGIFVFLMILLVATSQRGNTPTQTGPTPTPTATASAVSNRVLTSIASQSAFTKFEADLDALNRGIQNTQVQNQQLLPPRLDLPLGF